MKKVSKNRPKNCTCPAFLLTLQTIMKHLVTIAIPAYKISHLKEAVTSAVFQTYQNIEIVIVNDCSPYDIEQVLAPFNDTRIRYYKNEKNIGGTDLVAQWNKCLSYAQGEFFCLLCDDDVYHPDFVKEMVALSERYPTVDVFRARTKEIDIKGNINDVFPSSPEYETAYDYMWQKWKGVRRQTVSEFMIRTQHAKQLGGYYSLPRGWGSDSLSVFMFGMKNGIVSSTSILACFRVSGENISSVFTDDAEEKMMAAERYREKSLELIRNCEDEEMRFLLFKYEKTDYMARVRYILSRSTFWTSLKIKHRYKIGLGVFLKACWYKL